MDILDIFNIAMYGLFVGVHLWVLWELWTGRASTLTRWPSDLDGWARATQWQAFYRREEPTSYWMAWAYKASVLALCWCFQLI